MDTIFSDPQPRHQQPLTFCHLFFKNAFPILISIEAQQAKIETFKTSLAITCVRVCVYISVNAGQCHQNGDANLAKKMFFEAKFIYYPHTSLLPFNIQTARCIRVLFSGFTIGKILPLQNPCVYFTGDNNMFCCFILSFN